MLVTSLAIIVLSLYQVKAVTVAYRLSLRDTEHVKVTVVPRVNIVSLELSAIESWGAEK